MRRTIAKTVQGRPCPDTAPRPDGRRLLCANVPFRPVPGQGRARRLLGVVTARLDRTPNGLRRVALDTVPRRAHSARGRVCYTGPDAASQRPTRLLMAEGCSLLAGDTVWTLRLNSSTCSLSQPAN